MLKDAALVEAISLTEGHHLGERIPPGCEIAAWVNAV